MTYTCKSINKLNIVVAGFRSSKYTPRIGNGPVFPSFVNLCGFLREDPLNIRQPNLFLRKCCSASTRRYSNIPVLNQVRTIQQTRYVHKHNFIPIPTLGERSIHKQGSDALVSQEDLLKIVDHYEANHSPEVEVSLPSGLRHDVSSIHNLTKVCPPTRNRSSPSDPGNLKWVTEAIENESKGLDELFRLYQTLPKPGVASIDNRRRLLLLRRFSVGKIRNVKHMLRYLSLLEDMKRAGLPIRLDHWNSAVHLAGRCFARVTSSEMEAAMRIWKEMEQYAGVQSNVVTFNILFDIASKAGQFVIADMILEEMKSRNISPTRFSYVGLIYYHGIRQHGAGVRDSYAKLVHANQIVDTTVLNCVIVSLLRAGELSAAMNVYKRMRRMSIESSVNGLNEYEVSQAARSRGRFLASFAKRYGNDSTRTQFLQEKQDLVPDIHTFNILIRYHAINTGDLESIATLLNEMHHAGIPLHGVLFLHLFQGFSRHGSKPYTPWIAQRLEHVWNSFRVSVDQNPENVHVSKWMAIWILRAFDRCDGRDKSMKIWDDIRSSEMLVDSDGPDVEAEIVRIAYEHSGYP